MQLSEHFGKPHESEWVDFNSLTNSYWSGQHITVYDLWWELLQTCVSIVDQPWEFKRNHFSFQFFSGFPCPSSWSHTNYQSSPFGCCYKGSDIDPSVQVGHQVEMLLVFLDHLYGFDPMISSRLFLWLTDMYECCLFSSFFFFFLFTFFIESLLVNKYTVLWTIKINQIMLFT